MLVCGYTSVVAGVVNVKALRKRSPSVGFLVSCIQVLQILRPDLDLGMRENLRVSRKLGSEVHGVLKSMPETFVSGEGTRIVCRRINSLCLR